MKSAYELLRENFERWEIRGRGVLSFPEPVSPRPPFTPFRGHRLKQFTSGDDGVRHTPVSGWLQRMKSLVRNEQSREDHVSHEDEDDQDIEPDWCGEEIEQLEIGIRLPQALNPSRDAMVSMLAGLSMTQHPLSFEIVGTSEGTTCQWAASAADAWRLEQQLQTHFPEAQVSSRQGFLSDAWESHAGIESAVVEFALSEFFMWPLDDPRSDPFVPLIGSLAGLAEDELAVYQVLFVPVSEPWMSAALEAVSKADGSPFFDNGAELQKAARAKMRGPLYGVVLRMAAGAGDAWRAWEIVRGMAAALRLFSNLAGNEFFPLSNDGLSGADQMRDVILRRCHRAGMLLNQQELIGLAHLPGSAVQSPHFERLTTQTRAAPMGDEASSSVSLGFNEHGDAEAEVRLSCAQRLRHTHIIGGSGTGKTTLLLHMIRQDLESGGGFAVIDPHGDLITDVLGLIPEHRVQDIVVLDPSDEEFAVGFNIITASSELEKTQLASDLVAVFRRLSSSWGDQMNSVLANSIQVFLDHPEGGTLAELRRFLLESDFRQTYLAGVSDPELVYYWQRTFPQLGGNKSLGPILTRLENFLSPKPIRCMVSQQRDSLDIGGLMDSGKVLLARLPQGLVGRENCQLLGSLLVMRLQLAAINRQRMGAAERRPFWLYIDEFQDFITQSMAEILTGARKYGVGMVLAHQQLGQLQRHDEVAAAVSANTCTRVVFRCSDEDSRHLERGLGHFTAKDIQSLATGEAIVRLERGDQDFNLRVPPPVALDPVAAEERRGLVITTSHRNHAKPRAEIEAELKARLTASLKTKESKAPREALRPVPQEPPLPPPVVVPPVVIEPPAPPAPLPPEVVVPPVVVEQPPRPSGMGRGGSDHQLLVEQFCREGTQMGFRASKEHDVPDGRVDVVLEKRHCRVAIEVAVNSNTSHEIGNLRKCLEAGFDYVISVSPLPNVLANIQKTITAALPDEARSRVRCFSPEQLLTWLAELGPPSPEPEAPPPPSERRIGGRRVRIRRAEMSEDERKRAEQESLTAIADIISKKGAQAGDK